MATSSSVDEWFPMPPTKRKKTSSSAESDPETVEQVISTGSLAG